MANVVFITGHVAGSPLKATVTFLAEEMLRRGHEVTLLTVGNSWITLLKGQRFAPPLNRRYKTPEGLGGYVWVPPVHPIRARGRFRNALTAWTVPAYGLLFSTACERLVSGADWVFVETGYGLMFAPEIRRVLPHARMVLLMTDLLETLHFHPRFVQRAYEASTAFDIGVYFAEAMKEHMPATREGAFQISQGLDKGLFSGRSANPFSGPRNAISLGDMLFDAPAIKEMARKNPDWTIHLFGRNARLDTPEPNVVTHGETPFSALVAYLEHADIGIAPYYESFASHYLSQSSLKMVQYTYCRLPIVAPAFAAVGRPHVCAYDPGEAESIDRAFKAAAAFDRSTIDRAGVPDWAEVVTQIIDKAHLER